jgi:hypothetical protein
MQVLDDTSNNGLTTFEFSDGSTCVARQDHSVAGTPFIVQGNMSSAQKNAISQWSACSVQEA